MAELCILTPNPSSLQGGSLVSAYCSPVPSMSFKKYLFLSTFMMYCRMIEIGQKSLPQIFRQEGLAQKVTVIPVYLPITGNS